MSVKAKVEAVLFSSDEPLRVGEIADIIGEEVSSVSKAVKELLKEYAEREGAIEIKRIGNKYVMQLKSEYLDYAYKLGKKELEDDVLKTLAIIAYYQPVKQSELRDMLGPKVYEHVDVLKKRNFIYTRRVGKTVEIRTTKHFAEYFGIDAKNPEEIKKYLMNRLGMRGDNDEEAEGSPDR